MCPETTHSYDVVSNTLYVIFILDSYNDNTVYGFRLAANLCLCVGKRKVAFGKSQKYISTRTPDEVRAKSFKV